MLRLQEWFGAGPGVQTVAMVVQALLLGAAMTRWVERPAHRAVMRFFDAHGRRPPTTMSTPRPAPGPTPASVYTHGDLVGASSGP
jgi:hypothetical protein